MICAVSGLLFALSHLANLVGGGLSSYDLCMATLCQVIDCFGKGMLWAAVYLRCRNILAPILIHALFDLSTFISTGAEAASVSYDFKSAILTAVIFIVLALFYLRKSKTENMEFSLSDTQ